MFNSDDVLVPELVEAGFDPFRARVAMGGFLAGYSGKDPWRHTRWICGSGRNGALTMTLTCSRCDGLTSNCSPAGWKRPACEIDDGAAAVDDHRVLPVLHRRATDRPFPGGACAPSLATYRPL